MDKITRQVRIEHWTQIMNECLNSGMNKTKWCRANGISDKQFFYWQRILRKEAFEASASMAKVYTEEELNSFQPLGVRYSKPGIKVL